MMNGCGFTVSRAGGFSVRPDPALRGAEWADRASVRVLLGFLSRKQPREIVVRLNRYRWTPDET